MLVQQISKHSACASKSCTRAYNGTRYSVALLPFPTLLCRFLRWSGLSEKNLSTWLSLFIASHASPEPASPILTGCDPSWLKGFDAKRVAQSERCPSLARDLWHGPLLHVPILVFLSVVPWVLNYGWNEYFFFVSSWTYLSRTWQFLGLLAQLQHGIRNPSSLFDICLLRSQTWFDWSHDCLASESARSISASSMVWGNSSSCDISDRAFSFPYEFPECFTLILLHHSW